jgi:hypothetical protein
MQNIRGHPDTKRFFPVGNKEAGSLKLTTHLKVPGLRMSGAVNAHSPPFAFKACTGAAYTMM